MIQFSTESPVFRLGQRNSPHLTFANFDDLYTDRTQRNKETVQMRMTTASKTTNVSVITHVPVEQKEKNLLVSFNKVL